MWIALPIHHTISAMNNKTLLSICFLFSGTTSLALEIVWAKKLSYVLGNSLYGSSTVVAAFMAGLALGAYLSRLPRFRNLPPIKLYASLQILIAIGGFISVPVIDSVEPLFAWMYQSLSQTQSVFLFVRFTVVFALVVLPVTLMGMTLPIVVEAIKGSEESTPRTGGVLYGVNTLGALLGTLAAGYWLIPTFGLLKATWLIAGVDLALALILFGLARSHLKPAQISEFVSRRKIVFIDWVILISGFTAIALEVVWFRYLVNVFGASTYALTNMLATYLFGIAAGSLIGVKLLTKSTEKLRLLINLQLGVCFVTLFGITIYNFMPDFYINLYWWLGGSGSFLNLFTAQISIALLVVLAPTLIFGAMFPVFLAYEKSESHPVSRVYAYNTIGGIFGSLLAGFFILPVFGMDSSLRLLVAVNMALALALIFRIREPLRQRLVTQTAVLVGFLVVSLLIPRVDTLQLSRGVFMLLNNQANYENISSQKDRRILFEQEGINGSIAVVANEWGQGDLGLRVSSKPVAVTGEAGRRHLLLLGHLPMMFAKSHSDVAVIGYGTGITTGSVLKYPGVERLDVLELEKQVLAASKYFSVKNGRPLQNDKTRVHEEDGRIFLTYSNKKYDVITSDPISPWVAGAASLYSEDFYLKIKDRLNEGGVFCQWLQMGDYASQTYRGVVATIEKSFEHVAIFNFGHDSMILASQNPLVLPWQSLNDLFLHPPIAEELASNGINFPMEIINFLIAGTDQVSSYVSSTNNINNDDSVWLEYQMAKDLVSPREKNVIAKIIEKMIPGRMAEIKRSFPGLPIGFVAEHLLRNPPIFIPAVHQLIYEDATQTLGDEFPLSTWFSERATLEDKQAQYKMLWESSQANIRERNFASAQLQLEQLLDEVTLQGYYGIGIEYVRVSMSLGHNDKALRIAKRLQRMSPALPFAYRAEIELRNAGGDQLSEIVSRARQYIPDFVN
jgi:spermidine synthase